MTPLQSESERCYYLALNPFLHISGIPSRSCSARPPLQIGRLKRVQVSERNAQFIVSYSKIGLVSSKVAQLAGRFVQMHLAARTSPRNPGAPQSLRDGRPL
jgi:hypothetical protein